MSAEVLRVAPRVLGIYTNLMTKLNVLRLIRYVKSTPELKRTKIVLGGPEVKNHAENFLKYGAGGLGVNVLVEVEDHRADAYGAERGCERVVHCSGLC